MSIAYPEGEVYFKRSALNHHSSGFDADDKASFYKHGLVETVWNNRFCNGSEHKASFVHKHAGLNRYRADMWQTDYYTWSYQRIHFTNDKTGATVSRRVAMQNNYNANEIRDCEKGGPNKVVVMPFQLGDEKYMYMDLTVPVRAVYFPLAYQCDENFQDLCSYLMIDFRMRESIDFSGTTFECSSTHGLTKDNWFWTVGFDLQGLYGYLALPHQLRNPDFGLYEARTDGDELIWIRWNTDIGDTKSETKVNFDREMDLAKVVSANLGVDLVWTPYEFSSWAVELFTSLTEFALGFIPVVGPLLAVDFTITVTALTDPDFFESDDVLGLGVDVLGAILDSASQSKKFMSEGFHFAKPEGVKSRSAPDGNPDPDTTKSISAPNGNPKISLREERNRMLRAKYERTGLKPCPIYASRLEGLDQSSAIGAIIGSPGGEGALVKSAIIAAKPERDLQAQAGESALGESFVKLELRCTNLKVKEHTLAFH